MKLRRLAAAGLTLALGMSLAAPAAAGPVLSNRCFRGAQEAFSTRDRNTAPAHRAKSRAPARAS